MLQNSWLLNERSSRTSVNVNCLSVINNTFRTASYTRFELYSEDYWLHCDYLRTLSAHRSYYSCYCTFVTRGFKSRFGRVSLVARFCDSWLDMHTWQRHNTYQLSIHQPGHMNYWKLHIFTIYRFNLRRNSFIGVGSKYCLSRTKLFTPI